MAVRPQPRWATWVAVAVVLHCAFGVLRIPHAVFGKRWQEIAEFERDGEVAWLMATAGLEGVEAIATLRRTTPANAVIAIGGIQKGALEFAPALLWPRLCCHVDSLPAAATSYLGRPIADQRIVGVGVGDGTGSGKVLRLEPR